MPHINRIRVNNVKYNFGTQFYDDFSMRLTEKMPFMIWQMAAEKSVLDAFAFSKSYSKLHT